VPAGVHGHDVVMSRLIRPRQGRMIAGVCLGVADRFGCSVIPIRILTVAGGLLFGMSLWIYIALWILLPDES
jgi:phage shock protein C